MQSIFDGKNWTRGAAIISITKLIDKFGDELDICSWLEFKKELEQFEN